MAGDNGHAVMRNIPLGAIRENPVALRPVDRSNEDYLNLLDSIKKRGVLLPIVVREFPNPEHPEQMLYGLIDGLQRYSASLDAGMKEIPARVVDMDAAQIEETQIIANAQKIETKPVQYAQQIARLFERNPTLTISELANKLSKSIGWIHKMLGLIRNLHEEIKPLVDSSKIKLANACALSKLPKEEQATWVDRAMTQDPGEFGAGVASRVKAIKEARRKGREESPPVFEPVPHARTWKEIKDEFLNATLGPRLVTTNNIESPVEAFALAIAWCAHMDPASKTQQVMEHEARERKSKEESEKRALERTKQRQEEAEKTRRELEEKIAKREAEATGAPA